MTGGYNRPREPDDCEECVERECIDRTVGDRLAASRPGKVARGGRGCGRGLLIVSECFRFRSVTDKG